MPTYAYACTACGHEFDAQQSFSDDALTSCPECEGRLRKKFGAVGVVFKGSGFYRTDSRASSSGGSKESKDSKESKESGSKEPATAGASSGSSGDGGSSGSTGGSAAGATATAGSTSKASTTSAA